MNLNIPKKFIHQQVEGGGIISFLNEKEESRLMTGKEIVKCLNKQQSTITALKEENEKLKHYKLYEDNKRLQTIIADLKKENEQLRKELKEIKENPINYF